MSDATPDATPDTAAAPVETRPLRRTKVFFDGGCRPNPGPIEVAVVVRGKVHVFDNLGSGTNGDAEWQALVHALDLARARDLGDFVLLGDARAVIDRAGIVLQRQCAASPLEARFLALAQAGGPVRLRWVQRAQNLAGIALAARHPR